MSTIAQMLLASVVLSGLAYGQVTSSQAIVSTPKPATPVKPAQPAAENPDAPDVTLDPASLLPDLPRLPAHKASLIGGTIEKVDRVRDQLTLRIFGGGRMKLAFDPRTRIFRDGAAASTSDMRVGDRVSVDTMLDGSTVFARNIHIRNGVTASESQGVVTSYRVDKDKGEGELEVRDILSPQPLTLRLTANTRITRDGRPVSLSELAAGTLVAVDFGAQPDGHDFARAISILASPGGNFTFAGRVTALDLSTGLLVLASTTDGQTYEIHLDPSVVAVDDSLRPAAEVTVLTRFNGTQYEAQRVTVNPITTLP